MILFFFGALSSDSVKNNEIFQKVYENWNNIEKLEFGAVQKCKNLVELEKCCKMSTYLPKSVSIQKRTASFIF